jgi:hypothetical protein
LPSPKAGEIAKIVVVTNKLKATVIKIVAKTNNVSRIGVMTGAVGTTAASSNVTNAAQVLTMDSTEEEDCRLNTAAHNMWLMTGGVID